MLIESDHLLLWVGVHRPKESSLNLGNKLNLIYSIIIFQSTEICVKVFGIHLYIKKLTSLSTPSACLVKTTCIGSNTASRTFRGATLYPVANDAAL